jgi:ATP-dependent DNA helicase RecG
VIDFWNTVNNPSKVSRNLLLNSDVTVLPVAAERFKVICIEVPRASRRERPVYIGTDPFKGTYRRNHEGDYICRDDEVRRMFADQSEESADSLILEGFGLSDLDLDSIKQYRNRWASRADHVWLAEDDTGLLEKLGGWRRDRRTGEEGVTLAGLLMFGKAQSITAPEATPGFHVDYRERLSDDPNIRWSDRVTSDGTWEANIFQFYQRVMTKLTSDSLLKVPFQRNADGYRKSTTPVHEALQEALVNALIHADYRGQGGIVVDRYADRFEFSNPGTLLVSYDQLVRGSISECRNKSLQKMFQMLGVGDKAGSGIDKIRTSWAAQHWRSPSLRETFRPDRVWLLLPLVSMLSDELLGKLRRQFGSSVDHLSRDEVQAVATAATEGEVSNRRLQEMLPLHRVDITKLLQGLVREGFLVSEGTGRGTIYQLAGSDDVSANSPPIDANSPPIDANSPPIDANSPLTEIGVLL